MSIDWTSATAPDLAAFERLADEAFERLPPSFRELARSAVLRIDDFPSEEVCRELEAESEFDLLGLFTGVGLAHAEAVPATGRTPNIVHLYRRPILDYWAEHEETLGAIVAHVLIHEIGHHLGLSDDDIDQIEQDAA
ncbi:metallopeptidase family protein [Hansschlegelia plantiphila]|uniref:Zn-dependent protease n=1 Tax=Hansschlegelia plantiphila TaxID=374655 RepID=A0A9W6IZI4_9HYPH|nr:metallopeptidase family protein [Hansschlegelia plantiphila]GLK66485.1 hypothetical protein GCM10008179_01230 [Hansschlegelia plantiphila]